jgi:hypothetical protein
MKAATILTLLCCVLTCAAQPKPKRSTLARIAPDDCNQQFAGSARKAVKLRKASDGSTYKKVNGGSPISVSDWFTMTCSLDPKVPGTVPASKPMKEIETQIVTLQGFLMAAKLDPDHDLHAEIAGSNKWNSPHLIVEVPPGAEYCTARKALWNLVAQELPPNSKSKTHIMQHPPQVQLTGYVFLDTAHGSTNFCRTSGGRGVKKQGVQKVQGLWEIHPVLDLSGQ